MRVVRSERGSLPIVMLAILITASLATVLVGTMFVGQTQTRFDQSFEQSLQIAETGLDRMAFLVESKQRTDDFSVPETAVPAGGRYSGEAVRTGRDWRLTATGTAADGTSRTVGLTIRMVSVFGVAAFGRTEMGLRGSNSADSFRSGAFNEVGGFTRIVGGSTICGLEMCMQTGKGVVATNEELFLRGQVIDEVDRVEIHYAREEVENPLPGATGYCAGVSEVCASSKLFYYADPIELDPDPVVPPADLVNRGSFTGSVLPAGRQLSTNMTLDTNTVVQGTPDNPSVIYLTGTLTIPNHATVNFETVGGVLQPKPAPGLLIFSAGVGPALSFGNHAAFAGAVYAPRATFSGGAQGNVYGSMVTGSVSTQGGWAFHYDEALGDVETEAARVRSGWTED